MHVHNNARHLVIILWKYDWIYSYSTAEKIEYGAGMIWEKSKVVFTFFLLKSILTFNVNLRTVKLQNVKSNFKVHFLQSSISEMEERFIYHFVSIYHSQQTVWAEV